LKKSQPGERLGTGLRTLTAPELEERALKMSSPREMKSLKLQTKWTKIRIDIKGSSEGLPGMVTRLTLPQKGRKTTKRSRNLVPGKVSVKEKGS